MNSTTLTTPLLNISLLDFPRLRCAKLSPRSIRIPTNSLFSVNSFSPLHPLRVPAAAAALRVVRCSAVDDRDRPRTPHNSLNRCNGGEHTLDVAKPIACALFYVFIGFLSTFLGFRKPALAAVAAAPSAATVLREDNEEKGHEYSQSTRRLLGAVSPLLKIIEEARNAGSEDFASSVVEGLKDVKRVKAALQDEIMSGLHAELKALKEEKETLLDRSDEIVQKSIKARKEEQSLMTKAKGGGAKVQRLREQKRGLEKEYNDTWERIGEIEELIERKQTIALSIGVRELLAIERECEALVKNFLSEMRRRDAQR